jgi:hypothetical protein
MPRRDGGADGRREQSRHSLGLALVPGGTQALGIFEDLPLGRAPAGRFLFGCGAALIFHLAFIETHGRTIFRVMVSRKRPDWSRPLPRPLVIPKAMTLRMLAGVR